MAKPRIDSIEAAILSQIREADTLDCVPDDQVQTVSQRTVDFVREQVLVLPPAVVVVYLGGEYEAIEQTAHNHYVRERFLLIAVAHNLRGPDQTRQGDEQGGVGAYELLELLKDLFGGLRLVVDDDKRTYCHLVGTSFEGVNDEGHFSFGLEIEVRGTWDNVT